MKNTLNLLFMTITILLLQSCVADKSSTPRKTAVASSVKNTTTPTVPTFLSDEILYWFSAEKVAGTITVNKSTDNVIYLRGQYIHDFLSSKDTAGEEYYRKTFCLEAAYGGSYNKLKIRAVPIFISNYTTRAIERVLRVDLPSLTENSATCLANYVDNVVMPADSSAFDMAQICPSCLGINLITSTSLKMYSAKKVATANYLTTIPASKLNLASLALRVDLSSNSSSNSSVCTNSSCEAKGFDCCIEGQCVKDATVKASASTDNPTQYAQAMSDFNANPLSFINYPNIFNICANITHTIPPATGTTTNPVSAAEQRVKDYLADYTCIKKVETSTDYSSCSASQYANVKKKLAIACGCPATYTDDVRAIKCPDWGVRPIYKSTVEEIVNIIDFYCYTPQPANPIGAITNLNVAVSSRSAPHRFFATTGVSYDSLDKLTNISQEGEDFYYLDANGKTSPVNGTFNMNSVLGRMTVGLSQTMPAKMVDVELGKTYILSAVSGYYTPCSQCAKDSWFQTFTANPATTFGNGLMASGFSTSRDTYGANSTYGNYEDTHFGRSCYVPATMIPFSHRKNTSRQTQRLNRLSTQAAFYINGYQKDWYGFNKGALIGSFDGVTWFAVGTSRRITATSNKMYLAINAAFLDLADRTDTIVNIIPDLGTNVAPDYDFDPELKITDPRQNKAASCQQYYQCATDTDCVTQLGWEYTCADVSQMRTTWPVYDNDGKEVENQYKIGTIFEILQGTTTVGPSSMRCVYRGAGAPCVRDFTSMNGKLNQKVLTCAPNFYCAALSSNKFNNELVRSPNEFNNMLFGMDANVLGRPLNYVTAAKSLSADIIANIQSNANGETLGLSSAETSDFGICRPGKSLTSSNTAVTAHSNPDSAKRSDYISQVGSCDSGYTTTTLRFRSCPAFGEDLNYLPENYSSTSTLLSKKMQNSCGAEARNTASPFLSAFKNIEGASLSTAPALYMPTLAADACFRRPGSVCHTDLDCGPNKMHEEASSSLALSYFGGTEAERSYWQESLVCSQGTPAPALGSSNYYNYKLNENRCCREVGKDFTMYTTDTTKNLTVIPENAGSKSLITSKFSVDQPTAADRYSRYTVSPTALSTPSTIPSITSTVDDGHGTVITSGVAPAKNQWKVINETGSLNCCGGGWIRKFSDGTHDWRIKNRLTLETSNFSCLNFRSPLASPEYAKFSTDFIVQASYQKEYELFCKMPSNKGCMQIPYKDIEDFAIKPPTLYNPSYNVPADSSAGDMPPIPPIYNTRLDTSPTSDPIDGEGGWSQNMNTDTPYQPAPFYFIKTGIYDLDSKTNKSYNFFTNKTFDYGVSMYLPAYIPYDLLLKFAPSINKVYIKYFYENRNPETVDITARYNSDSALCDQTANYSGTGAPVDTIGTLDSERWCISANSTTQNRPVMHVKAYTGSLPLKQWKYAGIIIEFNPVEVVRGTNVAIPGNPYYYLTKLGRLELIGIPQITYEPLYCNNDHNQLVPGIFKTITTGGGNTRAEFIKPINSNPINGVYDQIFMYVDAADKSLPETTAGAGNGERRFTFQDKLDHPAIFSAKDFACCTPLGKEAAAGAKCCSGNAQTVNGKSICKLPKGANLSVYFNKFVSSEGVGDDQPGGGLIIKGTDAEVDFNAFTGEPKLRASTQVKLEELGKAYCASGIVGTGAAFGEFPPEPFSGSYAIPGDSNGAMNFPLSIVDSLFDSDPNDPEVGKFPFDSGFHWNHHLYCK